MAKAARAVQVPGEPAKVEEVATEQAQNDAAGTEQAAEVQAPEPTDEVAILRAQLEAERLARLEAEQRAAQAEQQAKGSYPFADRGNVNASEVQAWAAPGKSAHLSKAGWVVPAAYGSPLKA
jgi:hypothetical protein